MAAPPYSEAETSTEVDDAKLIDRSRNRPEDFSKIFDRHARRLHEYVARRLGPDTADDIVAETFLIAFQRRADYDLSRADAGPWLFGIATRLIGGHRRAEVRMYRAYARSGVDPLMSDALDERVADTVTAQSESPRLAAALAALHKRDRDPLLLHTWGDLSYEEIADALGIPVGTVRSRLHRARKKLRAALGASRTS
jgi:RNA polymerase sigma factor (sigma-70 family)